MDDQLLGYTVMVITAIIEIVCLAFYFSPKLLTCVRRFILGYSFNELF